MKIQLWSIGKANESFVEEGISIFTKRLSNYYPVEWKIIPSSKQATTMTADELKKAEGKQVLLLLKKEDYLVLLDENGTQFTSEKLANFIQQRANASERNIIFLIGGAYGVSEAIFERANLTWSLSRLVFPHQLVRLILIEQIYRACTINKNEKYHHK